MILRAALLAAALASAAAPAQAQLYRWTDEKGAVHVTDTPPPPSAKNVQQRKPAAAPGEASEQVSFELAQAMKDFPVVLYTAPNCEAPCTRAREALNQRGVPFREVQAWDPASREELKKLTGGAVEVPTLLVGRSVQKGFEPGAYEALLDAARYPRAGVLRPRAQAAPKPPADYAAPGQAAKPAPKPEEEPTPLGPYAPRFSK